MSGQCSGNEGPCKDYADQVDAIADVSPQTPENLNAQLSFPYPKMEGPVRPPGNGCLGCVHSTYCPALYWYRRNCFEQPDNYTGRQCSSWSNDVADIVDTINDFDQAENSRRACSGVLMEANRNALTDVVTGSNRP